MKKGSKHTEESKRKISEAGKKRKHTEETKKKMSETRKGHIVTEETKKKLSKLQIGHIVTKETRKKMSETRKGKYTGKNSPNWKGDKATFKAIHSWISHNKPRTYFCTICNETVRLTHFANISGEYKRNIDDYIELCPKCHVLFDKLTGNKQPMLSKEVECPNCGKKFRVEFKR